MTFNRYLFDSDSLIVAHRSHYSYEFCPAFWDWIITGNKNFIFFTIDRIADEIKAGNKKDYLEDFFQSNIDFILPTKGDEECLRKYAEIQIWASAIWAKNKTPKKTSKALEVFAKEQTADPWLVAYASIYGFKIISNEVSSFNSQTSIKLPDAAEAFNIEVVNLHKVLTIHSGPNFSFKK